MARPKAKRVFVVPRRKKGEPRTSFIGLEKPIDLTFKQLLDIANLSCDDLARMTGMPRQRLLAWQADRNKAPPIAIWALRLFIQNRQMGEQFLKIKYPNLFERARKNRETIIYGKHTP